MNKKDCESNCRLLFEYLRSILYERPIQKLDLEELEPSYQNLGEGMQFLQRAIEELLTYSENLSKGNLSGPYPSRDNFLCANLKNLHANLNHLTWQAKQVTAGDYSQHVSYLGEFSDAFNTMIRQLKERETQLKEEAEKLQRYNQLFMEMTRKRNEWILVIDADSRETLFCNKHDEKEEIMNVKCKHCYDRLGFQDAIMNCQWQDGAKETIWETGDWEHGFFRITTFPIHWKNRNAHVHVIEDITEDRKEAEQLSSKAYYDAGTGIYNRMYFQEYMKKALEEKQNLLLCYMDLDGLKFVNDNFGHLEGDAYIHRFVTCIQRFFRNTDIFARVGGDEFCLLMPNADFLVIKEKIKRVREVFRKENDQPYSASFSYGLVDINGNEKEEDFDKILNLADERMYRFKKENKENKECLS